MKLLENEGESEATNMTTIEFWNQLDLLAAATPMATSSICYRDGLTLQAIGDPLGITRERVRQLIQKGIRIIHARRLDVASILEMGTL